jgi:hypothetical protein
MEVKTMGKMVFLNTDYPILSKPFKFKDIQKYMDADEYIECVIEVNLSDLINKDIDKFNDYVDEKVLEVGLLYDAVYRVVGCSEGNNVLIKVKGQVEVLT